MDTKASSKVSCNANRGVLLKFKSVEVGGGVIFTNSPRREGGREVVRGKLQTNTVCFVCFFFSPPTPWKKQSLSSFQSSNNICKQLQAYKKGEGAQNTMQLTPLPIKTELNKSSSSNHSHMNTRVAFIQPARHFCPASADTILYRQCMCLIGLGAFISWDLCFKYGLIVKVCTALVNVNHYDGFHCVIKKKSHTLNTYLHQDRSFSKGNKGLTKKGKNLTWAPHIHCMRSVHVHLCVPYGCPPGEPNWSSKRWKFREYEGSGSRFVGELRRKQGIPMVGQIFTSPSQWSVSDQSFVFHKAGHSSKAAIKSGTFSPIIPLTWTPTPNPADVLVSVLAIPVAHFLPHKFSKNI